ncbi:MAG: hypothetical protein CK426_07335 [Legionella sp.]|nr:MAG: hypothetical protein CK423_03810 [Legionella sp.]PJD97696.1 MAG: hypothetical protein CK426_07335 [Legionella sp.]
MHFAYNCLIIAKKREGLLSFFPTQPHDLMKKNWLSLFESWVNQQTTLCWLLFLFSSFILHFLYMHHANLLVEEAYYWNYAQHLDWGYIDHPPMVALLIKCFTFLLGTNEFAVRAASLACWLVSAFFTYKWSELIHPQSGRYALLLLAVLPFFFVHSIVMTPDVPLISAWSACLYFIYRALILNQKHQWYWAGLWLGLGLQSKYTITLIPLTTLCFIIYYAPLRFWLTRKEPYLAFCISFLLFSPVLYWNAQHEWISFIFQSTRRFHDTKSTSLHQLILVVLLFISPLGFWSLWELGNKIRTLPAMTMNALSFIHFFTWLPLGFFLMYSLNHQVNFNWSGPLFLALIPWLAITIQEHPIKKSLWFILLTILLMVYSSIFLCITYNKLPLIQQKILLKVIDWDNLIEQFHHVAVQAEKEYQQPVVFVPLDNYPLNSELAFYQEKMLGQKRINNKYPCMGAHLFQRESLMYRYWYPQQKTKALLILLAKEPWRFADPNVVNHVLVKSSLKMLWSQGQGQKIQNIPYYYQLVELKPHQSSA